MDDHPIGHGVDRLAPDDAVGVLAAVHPGAMGPELSGARVPAQAVDVVVELHAAASGVAGIRLEILVGPEVGGAPGKL